MVFSYAWYQVCIIIIIDSSFKFYTYEIDRSLLLFCMVIYL